MCWEGEIVLKNGRIRLGHGKLLIEYDTKIFPNNPDSISIFLSASLSTISFQASLCRVVSVVLCTITLTFAITFEVLILHIFLPTV